MARHNSKRRRNKQNSGSQSAGKPGGSRNPVAIGGLILALLFAVFAVWKLGDIGRTDPANSEKNPPNSGGEQTSLDFNPTDADVAAQLKRVDPQVDGWDAEVFEAAAGSQLKTLGKLLAHPDELEAAQIQRLATDEFTCSPLRPTDLQQAFSDDCFTVYRAKKVDGENESLSSLADALRQLAEPFSASSAPRVKFKIVSVELGKPFITTVCYYQTAGVGTRGPVQQLATWRCRWSPMTDGGPPRLSSIHVEQFEEVEGSNSSSAGFADCTAAVMGANSSYEPQMLPGIDYWRQRLPTWTGLHYSGHHGLAVGDVNGDGLDDVYVCRPGGLPNRLFVQNADGTATDKSAEAGVDWLDFSTSALFIDLDNDGDQDLALVLGWGVVMMSNDGSGQFTKKAVVPVFEAMLSMSASDFDQDGDLDVYVCSNGGRESAPVPYHDANNGGRNVMIRNEGDWRFSDVTEQVGLEANNRRYSFAASWEDYDGDGDPDLYVSNDYGRNNLYQNNGGQFKDVASQAGVEDIAAGMSVDWADYNHDGLMDLYVSNMFSSAGSRITYQRRFKSDESDDLRSQFQRHARGNSLFENAGDGTFRDVSVEAGVTMGRWAWGSNFIDVNNDGREDIFIANGYVTQEDTNDL
jgi:hypothetical protein